MRAAWPAEAKKMPYWGSLGYFFVPISGRVRKEWGREMEG